MLSKADNSEATNLASIIWAELQPFDGRFNTAWRVAATCALTVMMFMIYGIPLVAIGCYLVLFVMKPNQAETMLMAIGICLLVAIMIPVLFGLTIISIEYPVIRMAVLIITSVFFMFLGGASQLGPAGGIIALVIVFILTILGEVPVGEVATRGILYAVLMSLVPMGTLLVFNAIVGPSVPKAVYKILAKRMQIIAIALENMAQDTDVNNYLSHNSNIQRKLALNELHLGQENLEKMLIFITVFHILPKADIKKLKDIAQTSKDMLLATAALNFKQIVIPELTILASQCHAIAKQLAKGDLYNFNNQYIDNENIEPNSAIAAINNALKQFPTPLASTKINSSLAQKGFFNADAWRNPIYPRYALKTTLAAVICYLIYTAIQWQDVHTALITCYVGALGTTAETLHKLTLRITGCLIGAAIGVLSIYFFMPYMTSIGQLMLLVFFVCLLAAWVSTGSELSSYAGVQIGLAFLLTVLVDFGPSTDMSHALYRTMGILLGNIVLYLVFTRIWPISAAAAANSHLQQILDSLQEHFQKNDNLAANILRADAPNALRIIAQSREQLDLIKFEPRGVHPEQEQIKQLQSLNSRLENLYLKLSFSKSDEIKNIQTELNNMQMLLTSTK